MFSTIKNIITGFLLAVLVLQLTASAQSSSIKEQGSNLYQFLSLQFDVSDIIEEYKANLLFNDNTCKQADRSAILAAQDIIINKLLLEFQNLSSDEQARLISQYRFLEVELEFVKNLDILIKDGFESGQNSLQSEVKKSLDSSMHSTLDSNFQLLLTKYEKRIQILNPKTKQYREGTYINCPTSWSSIQKRVGTIEQEVQDIQKEWSEFKDALNKVKSQSKRTFSPANLKDITINAGGTLKEGVVNSYQNLKSEWNESKKQAYQIASKPIQNYHQTVQQNQNLLLNRNDLGALLLSNRPITEITDEFNKKSDLQQIFNTNLIKNTSLQVTLQHSDAGYYSLISNAYQAPVTLKQSQQIFKTETTEGLLGLSKQVYNQQCRL